MVYAKYKPNTKNIKKVNKEIIIIKMKNITKIFATAVVILGFSANSFGQTSATATSNATATILATLAISNTTPLHFGVIGTHATETRIVVVTTAGLTTGSTATLYSSIGGPATNGAFSITGTPSATFSITLPSGTTNLAGPSGSTAMTIAPADWVSDLGSSSTLSVTGTKTLKVGATLQVGAAQTPGNYSGSYDVVVAYN
jgi:hypothetical protein